MVPTSSWKAALFALCLLAANVSETVSIQVFRLDIPRQVGRGQNAQLNCHFSLAGNDLYSVKWYKGTREFFRVVRGDGRSFRMFPLPELTIDVQKSNVSTVFLRDIQKSNAGTYRCEVSGEAPHFETDFKEANMSVIDLPLHGPIIVNVQTSYHPGELVSLNCTSAPANPRAELRWYIDGVEAPSEMLKHHFRTANNDDGTTTLGLEFVLDTNTASKRSQQDQQPVTLRNVSCIALVGDVYKSATHAHLSVINRRIDVRTPTVRTPSHMSRTTAGSASSAVATSVAMAAVILIAVTLS